MGIYIYILGAIDNQSFEFLLNNFARLTNIRGMSNFCSVQIHFQIVSALHGF